MSYDPSAHEKPQGTPGYIIVLAAFSVLMFLFVVGIGLVAFGVVNIGGNTETPSVQMVADTPLRGENFEVLDRGIEKGQTVVIVGLDVINTGTEPLKNAMVLVQCIDGGNVSTTGLIQNIAPDQKLHMELTLYGTGDPGCIDPVIDFDAD